MLKAQGIQVKPDKGESAKAKYFVTVLYSSRDGHFKENMQNASRYFLIKKC